MTFQRGKPLLLVLVVVVVLVFIGAMVMCAAGCEATSSIKGESAELYSLVEDEKPTVTESRVRLHIAPPAPPPVYRIVIRQPEPKP